jgi:hypothetical protein
MTRRARLRSLVDNEANVSRPDSIRGRLATCAKSAAVALLHVNAAGCSERLVDHGRPRIETTEAVDRPRPEPVIDGTQLLRRSSTTPRWKSKRSSRSRNGWAVRPMTSFQPGTSVVIEDGPLHGVRGTVLATDNRQCVIVAVNLLRCSIAVELDPDSVRIENPDAPVPKLIFH